MVSTVQSRAPAARAPRDAATLFAVVLVLALLVAYGAQIWFEGTTGIGGGDAFTQFAVGSATVVLGLCAHAGLAWSRGYFSALWPGLIFPVAFCAFHFATLGVSERGWFDAGLLPFAWLLCATSLLAWMLGHATTRGREPFVEGAKASMGGDTLSRRGLERLAVYGGAVFWFGIVVQLAVLIGIGLTDVLTADYNRWKASLQTAGGAVAAANMLASLITLVGLSVSATTSALASGRLFHQPRMVVGLGFYLLLLVLAGDRSEIVNVVIPLLLIRHYLVRRFANRHVAIFAIAAAMLFGGMKVYRGSKDLGDLARSATDPTVVIARNAHEAGSTMDIVVRSLAIVPDEYPFFHGFTYLAAFERVVPKVLVPGGHDFVSSVWITNATMPSQYSRAHGLGFSIVAEAYINFGAAAAPLVLFVIGLVHGRIERWLCGERVDPRLFVLFLLINAALILHVRNTAVLYVRGTIWSACIVFGLFALFGALLRREDPADAR